MARLGGGRGQAVEAHARKPVQPDQLDQRADLRLRAAQQKRAPPPAQSPGQHRQVEHQRGVSEGQLGQIDDEVALGSERPGERAPPQTLGGSILVPGTSQNRGVVRELDDDREPT